MLTVDLTGFGVVMTADSQPIEAIDRETRVLAHSGRWHTRNPILTREAMGFAGFTGFVGTETIGDKPTRDWLVTFGTKHPTLSLAGGKVHVVGVGRDSGIRSYSKIR